MKYYPLREIKDEVNYYENLTKGELSREKIYDLVNKERDERYARRIAEIPHMYKDSELESFGYVGDQVVDTLKEIFSGEEESAKGMLLTGPAGSGKTYAMYAIWKWIAERDPKRCILFSNYAKFMQQIRAEFADDTYRQQGSWWDVVMSGEEHPGVVMLDDLGTSKFSDFEMEKLYLILDERTNNYEPLILSANIPKGKDLKDVFGDRIGSRLNYFKRVEFLDVDLREELKKQAS